MPLDLDNETSGEGKFYDKLRFNAQMGFWWIKNEEVKKHFTEGFKAVFDMESVQTGWGKYNGTYLEFVADPAITERSPAPQSVDDEPWKRAFKVLVYSKDAFDGVVEINGQSITLTKAFKKLYSEFEAKREDGKLPVVSVSGEAIKVKDFYAPSWKIEKMVKTPDCFAEGAPTAPARQDGDEF